MKVMWILFAFGLIYLGAAFGYQLGVMGFVV